MQMQRKDSCHLDGKYLQTCIISKVDVITNKDSPIYYYASERKFKPRYNNHANLFCHRHHEQGSEF